MLGVAECPRGTFEPPVVSGDAEREGGLELRGVVFARGQNGSFVLGQWASLCLGLGLRVLCSIITTRANCQSKDHQPESESMLHCLTSSSLIPTLHTPPEEQNRTGDIAGRSEQGASLGSLPAQSCFAGPNDGLGTVGNLQLGEDVRDVVAHRLGTHVESPGYLGVAAALGYEVEDLRFTNGELWESFQRRGCPGSREEAQYEFGDLRPEVYLALIYSPDHLQDLLCVGALQDVASGSGAHGGEHRVVVSEHGEHHHTNARVMLDDPVCSLYAVHLGHLDIHKHYIRQHLSSLLNRLLPGGCLVHDLEALYAGEHGLEPVSEENVVVGYEDASGLFSG